MASIKTKQEMIDYCKQQMEYYLKSIKDCSDASYLRYYQGQVIAIDSMLANLGFDTKINVSLEAME